jgi:polar amino acid transport system substrate-binding protein
MFHPKEMTKMKTLRALTAPIASAACALALVTSASATELKMLTEDYAPLNFERDGQIVGIATDQVVEMMARAGVAYDMELTQWSRAINLAEKKPNTCVFAATHTAERDPKFQWIEPLQADRTVLVKAKGRDVAAGDVAAAARLRTGTQTGDYTVGVLEQNGFTKVDLSPTPDVTIKKLLAGRIDLMVTTASFLDAAVAEGVALEEVLVLSETIMAVACSKTTDPALVASMQSALKSIIDDGTQAEIQAKYN